MPKKSREEYNEYMRGYMARRYDRRMAAAKAQLGGKCAKCDATEELEFDHVDRSTKSSTIAGFAAGASEKRFQEELTKCQLLCPTHHRAKTADEVSKIERLCACGRTFIGLRQYQGHRRWCTT